MLWSAQEAWDWDPGGRCGGYSETCPWGWTAWERPEGWLRTPDGEGGVQGGREILEVGATVCKPQGEVTCMAEAQREGDGGQEPDGGGLVSQEDM